MASSSSKAAPARAQPRSVAAPNALDLRVIVCVTTEAEKSTSSTDGMKVTQAKSPYYARVGR